MFNFFLKLQSFAIKHLILYYKTLNFVLLVITYMSKVSKVIIGNDEYIFFFYLCSYYITLIETFWKPFMLNKTFVESKLITMQLLDCLPFNQFKRYELTSPLVNCMLTTSLVKTKKITH